MTRTLRGGTAPSWAAAALLILASAAALRAQAPPRYRLTNLGGLLGGLARPGSATFAVGLNDAGEVVGGFIAAHENGHAFLYSGGRLTDLSEAEAVNDGATAINAAGQIVGGSGAYHAGTFSRAGGFQALPVGDGRYSFANGLNGAGEVVGSASVSEGGQPAGDRAFAYSLGTGAVRYLPTLGGSSAQALAVNDAGAIVGESDVAGDAAYHAFLASPDGTVRDLGTLGGAAGNSAAHAINGAGAVVGTSAVAGSQFGHAFLCDGRAPCKTSGRWAATRASPTASTTRGRSSASQ